MLIVGPLFMISTLSVFARFSRSNFLRDTRYITAKTVAASLWEVRRVAAGRRLQSQTELRPQWSMIAKIVFDEAPELNRRLGRPQRGEHSTIEIEHA